MLLFTRLFAVPLLPDMKYSFTCFWTATRSLQKIWKEDASHCVSYPPSCLPLTVSSPLLPLPYPASITLPLSIARSLSLLSPVTKRGFGSKWAQTGTRSRTGSSIIQRQKLHKIDRRAFFVSKQFSFIVHSQGETGANLERDQSGRLADGGRSAVLVLFCD